MADGKEITDRIAKEENEADKAAFDRYITEPVKRAAKAAYEKVVGTPEQNKEAADRRRAQNEKNPNTFNAKLDKAVGMGGYAKGGKVSSASKRADGIAVKGKTKGRMV
jgi:hypothetical protein